MAAEREKLSQVSQTVAITNLNTKPVPCATNKTPTSNVANVFQFITAQRSVKRATGRNTKLYVLSSGMLSKA